ncbi:hypothetical protein MVES1_002155 [Malassezia vespertilionis]|uniref:protein-tyrosine-phosphatase n=1 Tax=Malassezia vespertilionis TaxID=2020962 RepID=A0A2N1JC31_9BASI|nr:uncharacterized protein MVES1_002155 [Malassezia vespertilionis]PKI84104.1 Cdc14p [Malassezia vespertilionis]WFD06801.1 hypothetical protein MVES1_002155 [Malassezia vespertilionis]
MLAVAAHSAENAAQHTPDDSDFQDMSQSGLFAPSAPQPISDKSVRECSLVHGLVPVSSRFWFGVFDEQAMPHPEVLNSGNGLQAAAFPLDLSVERPERMHWFSVDEDLVYLSFSQDWGPLNIAMFYRFCVHVHQMLIDKEMQDAHVVLYTSTHPHHKANAALLCALYAMTIDHICPADAFYPYSEIEFVPFRDAGYGRGDFSLTIQDILYGMRRALDNHLLDLTTFDLGEYEHYEQVHNGDWNWITPQFLAFASPKDKGYMAALTLANGSTATAALRHTMVPQALQQTIRYFKDHNVGLVVRLNNPLYNCSAFEQAGITHLDMYFDDGSNPSDEIVRTFIHEADRSIRNKRAIAVHCKAGLGRTGVLIGAYLIWKYGFTASEAIGYMRMMRPGCVVGPQQHYMYENAMRWVRWGAQDQLRAEFASSAPVPSTPSVKRAQDVAVSPRTKPTPCVGQPRKSPSPKRKRMLGADTSMQSRKVSGDSSASHDSASARSISDEFDAHTVETLTRPPCTDAEVLGVLEPSTPPRASPTATAALNAQRMAPASASPERATSPTRPRRAMALAQPAIRSAVPVRAKTSPRAATRVETENVPPRLVRSPVRPRT